MAIWKDSRILHLGKRSMLFDLHWVVAMSSQNDFESTIALNSDEYQLKLQKKQQLRGEETRNRCFGLLKIRREVINTIDYAKSLKRQSRNGRSGIFNQNRNWKCRCRL